MGHSSQIANLSESAFRRISMVRAIVELNAF